MSEYIECERLLLEIENDRPLNWTNSEAENQADLDFDCFIETIKAQPIADVAELKHGKWIMEYYETRSRLNRIIRNKKFKCSECGKSNGRSTSIYCSHCGAKMDLGL